METITENRYSLTVTAKGKKRTTRTVVGLEEAIDQSVSLTREGGHFEGGVATIYRPTVLVINGEVFFKPTGEHTE